MKSHFSASSKNRILLCILLTIFSIYPLISLTFNGEIQSLLKADDPFRLDYQNLLDQTNGGQDLFVVCESQIPQDLLTKLAKQKDVVHLGSSYGSESLNLWALPFTFQTQGIDFSVLAKQLEPIEQLINQYSPNCGLTGSAAYLAQSHRSQMQSLNQAFVIAIIGCAILFIFAVRAGRFAFLSLIPIMFGTFWGLAIYALIEKELTLLAASVPTLIFGIGIDHAIHLFQSTRQGMIDGLTKEQAINLASKHLTRPIWISTLSTSGVFFAISFSDLKGLVDFGIAGAIINLAVAFSCLLVLPTLLTWCPDKIINRSTYGEKHLVFIADWIGKKRAWIIYTTGIVTLLSVIAAFNIQLLTDNRKLENTHIPSREWQDKIAQKLSLDLAPILIQVKDEEQKEELVSPDNLPLDDFWFQPVLGSSTLVQVHSEKDLFDPVNYQSVKEKLTIWLDKLNIKDPVITGVPVLNDRLNTLFNHDAPKTMGLAILVLIFSIIIFQGFKLSALIALLPLTLSLCLTAGWMGLVGQPLSVITAAIAPLILGLGVDDGVHMLYAWQRHQGNIKSVFKETGIAICLTTFTTVIAFLAFTTTEHPALIMFGEQASFALTACLIVTLFVLPLVLAWRKVPCH